MTECPRAIGDRVREAAAEVRGCDSVIAADVLDPNESGRGRWAIEIVTSEPLPAAVLERLGQHDLSVPDAVARGTAWHSLATV